MRRRNRLLPSQLLAVVTSRSALDYTVQHRRRWQTCGQIFGKGACDVMGERLTELWWKLRWSSRATAWMHVFAMYAPFNSIRIFFYRLRGVRIGKNVYIVQGSFLEESRPWLITIEDDVRIGSGVNIATHDAVYMNLDSRMPIRYGRVTLKKGSILGPCCIVLPGVTVGEKAFVSAGAVVVRDVPPREPRFNTMRYSRRTFRPHYSVKNVFDHRLSGNTDSR